MPLRVVNHSAFYSDLMLRGFKVYAIGNECNNFRQYNRKDFYKISLITGQNTIHYAERTFETNGTFLYFGSPRVPYSWEVTSPGIKGFCCMFSDEFLKNGERSESLQSSPLFKVSGTPVLYVNKAQAKFIQSIFEKMIAESESQYAFKGELMRNCLQLIIHEALKLQPSESSLINKNAAERVTSVFLDLLERQFPIESYERPLELKSAQDFAKSLSVHVNYLNRSVKEITGKPTTAHIAERIVNEAKALLQHTDWNIAEIAYALGFEYPTYFNNFFKKKTGQIPKSVRTGNL